MSSFILEVVTPDRLLFQGRVAALTARAADGELQILSGHAPYINILLPGKIRLDEEDGESIFLEHGGGILEVSLEKASVMVYSATQS